MADRRRFNFVHRPGFSFLGSARRVMLGIAAATLFNGTAPQTARGQDTSQRKYIDRLNAPILAVSEDERAYKVYFEAHEVLDVADERLGVASERLDPYSATFRDALDWVGEPDQQQAVEMILKKNKRGSNATQRKIFGLPYGTYSVDDDLLISDFVVYLRKDMLFDRDEAYLPRYQELMALLRAEAFRRADKGDTAGGCDALLGMVRMARQLCDRRFYDEKYAGMNLLLHSFLEVRDFMWYYRDKLTIDDFKVLALELERLGLERIEMPSGEELIGEQLIEQIYKVDNHVDGDRFPEVMATFDSLDSPLKRFQAEAFWQQVADKHASRKEVVKALDNAVSNWKLRWRLPLHSSLAPDSEFEQLDDLKYAAVKRPIRDLQNLFALRVPLVTQLNGTVTAAGVHAYIVREHGKLIPGQPLSEADVPAKLAQIQPAFVNYESSMLDMYRSGGEKFHYAVVRNDDPRFEHDGYPIEAPDGSLRLAEFWPLLYSVGPDDAENAGNKLTHNELPVATDKCDILFFPNVDMMVREARQKH